MNADHAAALKRAQKIVDKPKMFKAENLMLAACYLELWELLRKMKASNCIASVWGQAVDNVLGEE